MTTTTKRPATALERLRHFVESVESNPGAWRGPYTRWVRHVAEDAPVLADSPDFLAAMMLLSGMEAPGLGSRLADAKKLVAEARRAPVVRLVGEAEVAGAVDWPVPVSVPTGYSVTRGGVFRVAEDGRFTAVCRAPVGLSGVARDPGSGRAHVTLTWVHADRWQTRTVPRGVAMDARQLLGLADDGFPVDSTCAALVVGYLAAAESEYEGRVGDATSVLGWHPGKRYQWGATTLGGAGIDLIADDGAAQIADGMTSRGTMRGWTGIWSVSIHHPRIVLAIYASLAPVLLGVIPDAPPFVVDFSGRTSGGKSTAMLAAASVWGVPDDLIGLWSDTVTNIERRAALCTHAPTFLDDTKHVRQPDYVSRTLYDVCASRGRGRGTVKGMQRRATLRTVLLSTGEKPAVTFSQDAGSRARTLSVRGFVMQGGDSPENKRTAEWIRSMSMEHHGHAGPEFVRGVAAMDWADLRARWEALRDAYSPDAPESGILGRSSGYLALLELAGRLLDEVCGMAYQPRALDEARLAAEAGAEDADRPKAALADLLSWMQTRWEDIYREEMDKTHFADRPIGRWDERGEPAIVRTVAERALRECGYSLDDVVGTWKDRGWLALDSEGKAKVRKRLGSGPPVSMLGFTRLALDDLGFGED